jgi:hypothetical protein
VLRSTNRAVDKCVAGSHKPACVNSARVSSAHTETIDIIEIIWTAVSRNKNTTARRRLRGGELSQLFTVSVTNASWPSFNHGRRYLWQVGADHLNRLTTTFSSSFTETGKGR